MVSNAGSQESEVNIMRQFWEEMTQMLTNEFSAVAAGALMSIYVYLICKSNFVLAFIT